MSALRSMMMVRAAAAPHMRALTAVAPQQTNAILARVQLLGLSSRAFSQARVVLAAAAPPAKEAPKAVAPTEAKHSETKHEAKHSEAKHDAKQTEQKDGEAAGETAVAEVPTAKSFSEIVQRYGGWYPFLGLAAVIAVSKEAIILNEEFLLVSNFAAMFATLYFGLGDTLNKAAEEQRAEIAKRQDELSDFEIEQLQALIQAHELNIEQVNVLKKLKTENNTLASQLITAKNLKVRHAAREAIVKKLGDIRSREASERASFRTAIAARATQYVQREFTNQPAAAKNSLIDFAIAVVEGKATQLPAAQDPVKKLYNKYFEEQIYNKEIEADKKAGKQ